VVPFFRLYPLSRTLLDPHRALDYTTRLTQSL
jgi:hypothetical protein